MKDRTLNWLYSVPGRQKIYIVFLILVQALHGTSGVLYALLLRNIVNSAVAHDSGAFWHFVLLMTALIAAPLLASANACRESL